MILKNKILGYYIMKCVNIERSAKPSKPIFFKRPTHDVLNHAWVKDLFKVQERSMNFKVTEYENVTDMVSDSTLQLPFKKLPFLNFGVVSKKHNHNYLKKLLKYFSLFYLHIFVRPDFLHILQQKKILQQIEFRSSYVNPAIFF